MNINQEGTEPDVVRYLRVAARRWKTVVGACAFGVAGAAAYAFLWPPVYQASALVDVEKPGSDIPEPNGSRQEGSSEFDDYFETQARLIASDTQLRKAYAELDLGATKEFGGGVPALRKAVLLVPVPHSRLCFVNVESADPRRAAAIAGWLAHSYVTKNLDSQLFMTKKVFELFKARLSDPKSRQLIEGLPAVVNNRVVQDLTEQIYTTQAALADLRTRYTDDYPAVAAQKSRLASLRGQRDREMNNILASFKSELSGQFRPNNARVVDEPAVPDHPVRPRKALALFIGFSAGLAIGVIVALMLETVGETVLNHHDVEQKIGIPFLSLIPFSPESEGQGLVPSDAGPASEAFRNLMTLVKLSDGNPADPFLLVTSTTQSEGKSFVAANLAVALSRKGERVLLVDGDLRNPSQHLSLSSSSKTGLCDFLAGRVTDAARIAHESGVPNLDLVTCGVLPKNPAELLNAGRLADFVAWARERYARVVVDCSPVFPVSDVLMWARQANRAIFVARYGRTPVPMIRTACSRLRAARTDIVGGVINGARVRTMTYADRTYFERY